MAVALPQTTAELLLRAAEAVHVLGPEVSTDDVAAFLGGTATRAKAALGGAEQLELVVNGSDDDHWCAKPLARLCAHSAPGDKTVILRFQLEQFAPYAVFRDRIIAGEASVDAARQACLSQGLTVDTLDAEETLIGLGGYSGGLIYGDDRQLLVALDPHLSKKMLAVQERVMAGRDTVRAGIVDKLGVDAASFSTGEILDFLVDSYMTLLEDGSPEDAMFQLGKGLEAWLKKLVTLDPPLPLPNGTNTMGAVAKFLKDQRRMTSKHHAIFSAVIAIRNAADHSADPEIGATWQVTRETAFSTSHLTWSAMRSFFSSRNGNFEL